jgi:hypothetical protein
MFIKLLAKYGTGETQAERVADSIKFLLFSTLFMIVMGSFTCAFNMIEQPNNGSPSDAAFNALRSIGFSGRIGSFALGALSVPVGGAIIMGFMTIPDMIGRKIVALFGKLDRSINTLAERIVH